jgi:hypothetical protein
MDSYYTSYHQVQSNFSLYEIVSFSNYSYKLGNLFHREKRRIVPVDIPLEGGVRGVRGVRGTVQFSPVHSLSQ